MTFSPSHAASLMEDAHVPILVAMRLRDFRVVLHTDNHASSTNSDVDARLRTYFSPLNHEAQADTQDAPPSLPWLRLTLHEPNWRATSSQARSDTIVHEARTSPSPFSCATAPLAQFNSEHVLVMAHAGAGALSWPDFDPAVSLSLPAAATTEETASSRHWRTLLSQITVTVELCDALVNVNADGNSNNGDDGSVGGADPDEITTLARCHFTLAQLLLETYPQQPVQATLRPISRGGRTRTGGVAAAGGDTLSVCFHVEAQQVQTLQVLVTAVVLQCAPTLPALDGARSAAAVAHPRTAIRQTGEGGDDQEEEAEEAATALASVVPAAGSELPALVALRIGGVDTDDTQHAEAATALARAAPPLVWADRQDVSEATFRWTALPRAVLPTQTLQATQEDGVHGVVYARSQSQTGKAGAVRCGRFQIPLTALLPTSTRLAAQLRSDETHNNSTTLDDAHGVAVSDVFCSQTFRVAVDWSPSPLPASSSSSSRRPPPPPGVVHGVIEVRRPFTYVQNGGSQYSYAPEMLEAAMQHETLSLAFRTDTEQSSAFGNNRFGRGRETTPSPRVPPPPPSAPRGLTEDSQLLDTVSDQQGELLEVITQRLQTVQRQREALLHAAAERRRRAEDQKTAAEATVAALTAQLAEQRVSLAAREADLARLQHARRAKEESTAQAAAERRLLAARVQTEREAYGDLRQQLVTLKARMTGEMSALARQSTVTTGRIEGLLMESVLSDSDSSH